MASVSSHTGSATVKNRTNNGSDVVLGDRRQFKTQRSDPLDIDIDIDIDIEDLFSVEFT